MQGNETSSNIHSKHWVGAEVVCGLEFELETDDKPLECIFDKTSKPSTRIERWVLRLQCHDYKVVYHPRRTNIADALS